MPASPLAAGLTREQAVRVYSFETGGTGNYDVQSGIEHGGTRAISTAMGYNQLLTTNSVELVAEQGHEIVAALTARAAQLSGAAAPGDGLQDRGASGGWWRSRARCRTNGRRTSKLADTQQGWAVHAMVLDIDVGPLLQTHKLLTSVIFARAKGYTRPLTAAELEMMNLTGDGTGLDMVTMPQAMREQVPTSNFFQRSGYERNPVAIRHNTVAKLLAVTDEPDGQQQQSAGRQGIWRRRFSWVSSRPHEPLAFEERGMHAKHAVRGRLSPRITACPRDTWRPHPALGLRAHLVGQRNGSLSQP